MSLALPAENAWLWPYIFVNCYLHGMESVSVSELVLESESTLNWANRPWSCCRQLLFSMFLRLLVCLVGVADGLMLALHRNAIKTGSA